MLKDNLLKALELYDTYVAHLTKNNQTSSQGLVEMKNIFATVSDENKALIFSVFLQFLRDDGVEFDVEQFQAV